MCGFCEISPIDRILLFKLLINEWLWYRRFKIIRANCVERVMRSSRILILKDLLQSHCDAMESDYIIVAKGK